jgi:hypothetical protein
MNTPAIAQNLAARGRGEDKMLVHMTPSEVQGLQALAMAKGGSLTINPETGLPEAGFLSDTFKAFLPTIAGVALSPIMGPVAAGLLVGGVQAARTKDLGQGIMAGLGAYGGAGLGKSLTAMGTPTAIPTQVAGQTGAGALMGGNLAGETLAGQTLTGSSVGAPFVEPIAGAAAPVDAYSAMGTGAKGIFTPGGVTNLGQNLTQQLGSTGVKVAGLGTAANALNFANQQGAFDQPEMAMAQPDKDYNYEGPYLPAERNVRFRGGDDILRGSGEEFRYFDRVNPYPAVRTAADGGLMSINKMAAGRYLQGGGDGTSDSIPAVIGNDQPARLADGEFVLDARTVSEIGNGSSDAGARKLYALMDNVHKARQSADRGKPSGADQLLKGLTATA